MSTGTNADNEIQKLLYKQRLNCLRAFEKCDEPQSIGAAIMNAKEPDNTMMKVEDISSEDELIRYVEGCLNDFEHCLATREETTEYIIKLIPHICNEGIGNHRPCNGEDQIESKYTKDQILDAITKHWIEDFGCMQSEEDERDGYFVTGFVLSAIQKWLEPVVQVERIVSSAVVDWKEIGEEDYIARYKKYDLRLEAMDMNLWWFQVYHYGHAMWHEGNFVFTKEEAERKMLTRIETILNE